MSLDNLPFSRNNFAACKASIFPCLMLFSSKVDGDGNSSKSNLYDCKEVYRNNKANYINGINLVLFKLPLCKFAKNSIIICLCIKVACRVKTNTTSTTKTQPLLIILAKYLKPILCSAIKGI